jgi:hypothetical protein
MWNGIVSNGDGALIIPAGDKAFAQNIFQMLWEDENMYDGLLEGARRLARDLYSEEALVSTLVSTLCDFSQIRSRDLSHGPSMPKGRQSCTHGG